MGQVVTDITTKTKADSPADRQKKRSEKISRQQLEDIEDGESADRVVANYHRSGVSYTVDELRKRYGL